MREETSDTASSKDGILISNESAGDPESSTSFATGINNQKRTTTPQDKNWQSLRKTRICILVTLLITGAVAGALTYVFSSKIQADSFELQVMYCLSFKLDSIVRHPV